ncbi:MAG TPA: Holliday junction branch migration protein RuvA [Candidatus Paceibacterota bacterium]|nr:Holliday junction branch migration protein RuvA [Candidatus Paceibacterota bacterium]
MISYLEGKILEKSDNWLILNVGGVGYKIHSPLSITVNAKVGEGQKIWTHHAIRENSHDLYGFVEKKDLEMFELLLTISGIGPKSALSILNIASTETIVDGIKSGDPAYLSKISGISKKNSEKIILSLKEKIGNDESDDENYKDKNSTAIDALVSLGYSEKESRDVVRKIYNEKKDDNHKSDSDQHNTEQIIKKALKKLSGN